MLNRRLFLGLLGAAAGADPERLLWVPGKKKIFIPKEIVKPDYGVLPRAWLVRVPRLLHLGGTYSPDGSIGRGSSTIAHYELFWYPVGGFLPPGAQVVKTVEAEPLGKTFFGKNVPSEGCPVLRHASPA